MKRNKRKVGIAIVIIVSCLFILTSILYINHMKIVVHENEIKEMKNISTNPFVDVKASDIDCITKKSSGPGSNVDNFSVLFSEENSAKTINLINSSSSIREYTKEDLEAFQGKGPYPTIIEIKMKNGSRFSLIPGYQVTKIKSSEGYPGVSKAPYEDRFILEYNKDSTNNDTSKIKYYTLFSADAEKYILKDSDTDYPMVSGLNISPENFKLGEPVVITGDGYTSKEINVCIRNNNVSEEQQYIIAKVKTQYGNFKWTGVIDSNMKTYDGKDILFKGNQYEIIILSDSDSQIIYSKRIIDFSKDEHYIKAP